ncbi:MAG TPA: glycosyltransferase [bacterium]|nr:glycosyltransferase [bacterium]
MDALEDTVERKPKVSIVIPVYNDEAHIADAIESVLGQTLREIEIIVVDDGSTDGTCAVLRGYEGRITCLTQSNSGQGAARNAGILASGGRYVCFLDSDDTYMPNKVEVQSAFLDEHPDVGLCYSGWLDVDVETGRVLNDYSDVKPEGDPTTNVFPPHFPYFAALLRREWLERVGVFDERFRNAEDTDLWWRLWAAGCVFRRVKGVHAVRGVRPASLSRNVPQACKSTLIVYRKYFAMIGSRASRAVRIRRLAGVSMKLAGHYIVKGDIDHAEQALKDALRYDRHLLGERTYWLQLLGQLDLKYPFAEGEGIKSFTSVWRQLKALISDVLGGRDSRTEPEGLRKATWALAYALSLHAAISGRLFQTLRWFIVGTLKGRVAHAPGFAWLLVRRFYGRATPSPKDRVTGRRADLCL